MHAGDQGLEEDAERKDVTWSKTKASLDVLRQKEKEGEQTHSFRSRATMCAMGRRQASQKLLDKKEGRRRKRGQ